MISYFFLLSFIFFYVIISPSFIDLDFFLFVLISVFFVLNVVAFTVLLLRDMDS